MKIKTNFLDINDHDVPRKDGVKPFPKRNQRHLRIRMEIRNLPGSVHTTIRSSCSNDSRLRLRKFRERTLNHFLNRYHVRLDLPPVIIRAIVFDGRLWHGAGANTGNATRIGLLTTFCAPMFRQQENYTLGTAPEIVRGASERLLTLLGLKPWLGYGRVGSDTHKFVERESDVVGELGPT